LLVNATVSKLGDSLEVRGSGGLHYNIQIKSTEDITDILRGLGSLDPEEDMLSILDKGEVHTKLSTKDIQSKLGSKSAKILQMLPHHESKGGGIGGGMFLGFRANPSHTSGAGRKVMGTEGFLGSRTPFAGEILELYSGVVSIPDTTTISTELGLPIGSSNSLTNDWQVYALQDGRVVIHKVTKGPAELEDADLGKYTTMMYNIGYSFDSKKSNVVKGKTYGPGTHLMLYFVKI